MAIEFTSSITTGLNLQFIADAQKQTAGGVSKKQGDVYIHEHKSSPWHLFMMYIAAWSHKRHETKHENAHTVYYKHKRHELVSLAVCSLNVCCRHIAGGG